MGPPRQWADAPARAHPQCEYLLLDDDLQEHRRVIGAERQEGDRRGWGRPLVLGRLAAGDVRAEQVQAFADADDVVLFVIVVPVSYTHLTLPTNREV